MITRIIFDSMGVRYIVVHMYDRNAHETEDPKLADAMVIDCGEHTHSLSASEVDIYTVH